MAGGGYRFPSAAPRQVSLPISKLRHYQDPHPARHNRQNLPLVLQVEKLRHKAGEVGDTSAAPHEAKQGLIPPATDTCRTPPSLVGFGFCRFCTFCLICGVELQRASSDPWRKQQKPPTKVTKKPKCLRKTTPREESCFLRHCLEFYWQQGSAFHMLGPGLAAPLPFPLKD